MVYFVFTALLPSATFPTQLRQAVAAIEHLMSTGVSPQNIQIAGDSAGANLALQLIFHILHPLQGIHPLSLPSRIGGIYLMSPWIGTTGKEGSMGSNDGKDVIACKSINDWGQTFLNGVPHSQMPYVAASRAPASWFKAVDTTVERILITVGSTECMRDSIEEFAMHICNVHEGAMFWMQENGVHNDLYFDFFSKEAKLGTMTAQILEWFVIGFSEG
jgi:acetyl esterase/lipase